MNTLTATTASSFGWVLQTSWQAAVLAGIVCIVQWLFRKKLSASWRYGLWLLVIARLLMPVPPQSAISVFNLARLALPATRGPMQLAAWSEELKPLAPQAQWPAQAGLKPEHGAMAMVAEGPVVQTQAGSVPKNPSVETRTSVNKPESWLGLAAWVWGVGVFVLGMRLVGGHCRFHSRLVRQVPVSDEGTLRLLRECASLIGVRGSVTVIETEEVESPALFGLWNKRLLLPEGIFERLPAADLRYIFLHELAHLKRRDLEMNWLTAVLQIAHWFNPMLWLAFARMRADRELATDALALSHTRQDENVPYGETILKVVEGLAGKSGRVGLVGIAESKARLKERLLAIARAGSAKPWRWAAAGIALILAGVGLTGEQRDPEPASKSRPSASAQKAPGKQNGVQTNLTNFGLRVLDYDTGRPLPGATVVFTLAYYGPGSRQQEVLTDQDGRASIRYAATDLQQLAYRAHKANYLSLQGEWFDQELGLLGKEYEIKLSQGVEIGGSVTDESGKPVAGAEISWDVPMNMVLSTAHYATEHGYMWVVSSGAPVAVTDANGNWKAKCIWPDVTLVSLRIHHPDFADVTCSTVLSTAMEAEGKGVKVSFDELKQHRTRLIMTKGVAVSGQVLNEHAGPVAGIQVSYAELLTPQHTSDPLLGLRTVTTDATGVFHIKHAPQKHLFFLVQTAGYAPAVAELDPRAPGSEIELSLEKGLHFVGEVLDEEGNAISGARVSFRDFGIWRGVHWEAITDNNGRFVWEEAPVEKFQLQVEKNGFITQSKIAQVVRDKVIRGDKLTAEAQIQRQLDTDVSIRLKRTLHISGKVLDADTKRPINSFQLEWLDRSDPQDLDSGYHVTALRGTNGAYSLDLGRLHSEMWFGGYAHESIFRIRADGYAPEVSRTFSSRKGDVGEVAYDVELKPVGSVLGMVVDADGQPIAKAQVALAVPAAGGRPPGSRLLLTGGPFFQESGAELFRATDSAGQFHLNVDSNATGVIAVHDMGFGMVNFNQQSNYVTVKLEPWGRIEGTAWEYERIVTNQQIWASAPQFLDGQTFRVELRTNCDSMGRFSWNFVPPGKFRLSRMIPMAGGGAAGGPNQLVEVKSGATSRIKLGGQGRRVVGRFKIKNPYVPIDWVGFGNDYWVSSVMPRPPAELKTAEEYKTWRKQPEIERAFETSRYYPLQFAPDGSFHLDEMLPGKYQLQVRLLDPRDPDAFAYQKHIGEFSGTFDVPVTTESGRAGELDLGVFEMSLKPQLVKGETVAPEFEATDMDEKKFKLADFRGKYVLLDFWATWCGPCVGEIPYLKQVYEKFKSRKDFVIISLSLDKSLKEPREFLKKNELLWVQGFLGEWSGTKVPAEYGVQGIPALFLVNPEGKILESELEGSSLVAKLEKHLP